MTGRRLVIAGALLWLWAVLPILRDGMNAPAHAQVFTNTGSGSFNGTVTNAGTFVVQENGGALTSLQLLDDAIQADSANWTNDSSKGIAIMGVYQSSPHTVTDNDFSPPLMTANGRLDVHVNNAAVDVQEDVAETNGATGPLSLTVRRNVAAASTATDAEYATANTDALGLLWTRNLDPCSGVAKSYLPISISTATTTEITPSLAGSSTHYYICSLNLVTLAANNVLVADDNTDGCGSPTAGIFGSDGSPTAGEGWNFAANGGIALGNGTGSVGRTQTSNSVICILTSASTQLSGMLVVAAAP